MGAAGTARIACFRATHRMYGERRLFIIREISPSLGCIVCSLKSKQKAVDAAVPPPRKNGSRLSTFAAISSITCAVAMRTIAILR